MARASFTPEEIEKIQTSFRRADNPARQIGILAELHDVSEADIRDVLGLEKKDDAPARATRPYRKHPPELREQCVREVLDEGKTQAEVAEAHGIVRNLLTQWVCKERKRRAEDQAAAPAAPPELPEPAAAPPAATGTEPLYHVYCSGRLTSGMYRATDDSFSSLEAASRWVFESVLNSERQLGDFLIVQEYAVLPVWQGC